MFRELTISRIASEHSRRDPYKLYFVSLYEHQEFF